MHDIFPVVLDADADVFHLFLPPGHVLLHLVSVRGVRVRDGVTVMDSVRVSVRMRVRAPVPVTF